MSGLQSAFHPHILRLTDVLYFPAAGGWGHVGEFDHSTEMVMRVFYIRKPLFRYQACDDTEHPDAMGLNGSSSGERHHLATLTPDRISFDG